MEKAESRLQSLFAQLHIGWGRSVWVAFCVVALVAVGAAALWPAKFSGISTLVGLGLAGLLIAIVLAFDSVRDDHEEAMPSWLVRLLFSFSLVAVLLFSIIYLTSQSLIQLAAAFAGAAAAFAVGAFAGFIFGVPRAAASATTGAERSYAPNTNFERISEWLTGMIVGLTLVQFDSLRKYFIAAAQDFQHALGQKEMFIASALLLFFAVAGFLIAYLWTRLRLLSDLTRADDVVRREPEYFEGLMHAHLYSSPPEGFRRAVARGLEYRKFFRIPNVRVLVYLACAYGQQHKYLVKHKARGAEKELGVTIEETKTLAHDVTKECLELDEGQWKLLRSLWDPHDEQLADDDLESLYEEEDFRKLFDDFDPKKKAGQTAVAPSMSGE
jgi:hypothetical protein